MRSVATKILTRSSFLAFASLSLILAGFAQAQPSENCTGADLGGGDSFPLMGNLGPTVNDFTMTGAGCAEQGVDTAVCFTPELDCTVTMRCENDSGMQSANLVAGPCNTSPASCIQSDTGTEPELTNVALTAGQNVCLVCEFLNPGFVSVLISESTPGECGALPVELLEFFVDRDEEDGQE